MKNAPIFGARFLAAALLAMAAACGARASDHADPMSLNVFKVQDAPEANITDLHVFVADRAGHRIREESRMGEADQLIVSLCMRRALQPQQIEGLQLKGYKFRVHLDLNAPVRFFEETKTRDGGDFQELLARRNAAVDTAAQALESARQKDAAAGEFPAEAQWEAALAARGALLSAQQSDRAAQALYGGIVAEPAAIAEDVLLEFELDLIKDGENSESVLARHRVVGLGGEIHVVSPGKRVGGVERIARKDFRPGAINVRTGVFDDPFIFPRFFRRNVVAVVTSIPLSLLPAGARTAPLLAWATTHGGGQIDHVGRSLRSQLPRFEYLNQLPPAEHVAAITRIHDRPSVMENAVSTFIAPLLAHRHYDGAPDVMIYNLAKPARFPNGRGYEDDVAQILAQAGETLLWELSYSESRQFPRATINDKPFSAEFPYLAPRWTKSEVAAQAQPGGFIEVGDPGVEGGTARQVERPRAADGAAIAPLNFTNATWQTLWGWEAGAIALLSLALILAVRSKALRWALVAAGLFGMVLVQPVRAANLPPADPGAMAQPGKKIRLLLEGGALIGALALGLVFALGRRSLGNPPPSESIVYPAGRQEITAEDQKVSSYPEIHRALFDPGGNGQYYKIWGGPGERPLPLYKQTFATITGGLLKKGVEIAIARAARRTVGSRGDLRWGADGKGFRRLVHPIGICLAGTWSIDADSPMGHYTGYFAPGSRGRVIARYSLGGNDPRNGRTHSMGMVGKLFPLIDPVEGPGPRAHFVTQEDLGGAYSASLSEVLLTNSPPVSLLKRGPGLPAFLAVIVGLMRADKQPAERQLYEVAELEKPASIPTNAPRFMRLRLERAGGEKLAANEADFRDEILEFIHNPGQPGGQRALVFSIEVSDAGERTRFQKVKGQKWTRIGELTFSEAAASYNGDFVIHFHHPVWRNDRNDPRSVARPELRG